MGGNVRPRSCLLYRQLAVASLAAVLLMLSNGLPVVHATIPYYPYECPIGSGGRDFDGNGQEGVQGLPSWDPRSGLWFSSNQGDGPVWGTWGDIPTPGNFNGDANDDYAVFRPSTGTWFVACSCPGPLICLTCPGPGNTLTVVWGQAGDIPVPADFDKDGTTDYGVWRPSNGAWYVRSGASGATLVNGVVWGQFGDCPMAANLTVQGASPMTLNVFRPSNGVWYQGASFTGTGGIAFAFGAYGDIPFAPDLDGDGDGDEVVFRPSTATWYGQNPAFSITWGQPGDIPAPRSRFDTTGQAAALTVYRPTTGLSYNCFAPAGAACFSTNVEGPSGSGVVPLQGRWK